MKAVFTLALLIISSLTVYSQNFYLATNGVTCMCPNAAVGDSGDPGNGIVYTKRTRSEITPQNAATTCTSGITDMSQLFLDVSNFNEDISTWDVSNVTSMRSMFNNFIVGGNNVFNQDLSYWDVSNVTDMSYMFQDCYAFNSDISTWDVSNVTNMSVMFEFAYNFNQDISTWDVSNVTNMFRMFSGADLFNQPIGSWNVSNVSNFASMFFGYDEIMTFDQDLSAWEFNGNLNQGSFAAFLSLSGMSTENYDLLLNSIADNPPTPNNYIFGAQDVVYCDGGSAREYLISQGFEFDGDSPLETSILAPSDLIYECPPLSPELGAPNVIACGDFVVSNNAPLEYPEGITEITWTLVDGNGSISNDIQNVEVLSITDKADVCYVTSDWNNPSKNRIWITSDPALSGQNVAYHEVFREAPSGVFETIGFINPPEESFLDTSSDNTTQAYRYKVQTIDVCGQELTPSEYHKTILLQSGIATDNSVNLAWNPYVGVEFSTYNIYRSVNGAAYELLTSVAASNITYNDTSADVINNFYQYFVSIDVTSCGTNPFQPLSLRSNQEYVNPNLVIKDNTLLSKSIVLYPNPASELINISASEGVEVRSLILYSALGQRIMSLEGVNSMDVSMLPSGVYYMTIETDQGRVTKSVVRR